MRKRIPTEAVIKVAHLITAMFGARAMSVHLVRDAVVFRVELVDEDHHMARRFSALANAFVSGLAEIYADPRHWSVSFIWIKAAEVGVESAA